MLQRCQFAAFSFSKQHAAIKMERKKEMKNASFAISKLEKLY
jgi:hypothetical protein